MKIAFRVDGSWDIGTGHVMRCLTLAKLLRSRGGRIGFITRSPVSICNLIEDGGFDILSPRTIVKEISLSSSESDGSLSQPASRLSVTSTVLDWRRDALRTIEEIRENFTRVDWLIVDHYGLDAKWERAVRTVTDKIMVLDDLANRSHDCDLLLDQNLYANPEARYKELIPSSCITLFGPRYCVFREEFMKQRKQLRSRDGKVRRLLLFFGGSDPAGATQASLRGIAPFVRDLHIDVIVGSSNKCKNEIETLCDNYRNINFYWHVSNMAEMLNQTDFVIGAGGTSLWERCFLGVPSVTVIIADNQIDVTKTVAAAGATWNLGTAGNVNEDDYLRILTKACRSQHILQRMSQTALSLTSDEPANEELITHLLR